MMTLYGLTCGFWTDDPDDLDEHVLAHPGCGQRSNGDPLYDLFDSQAPDNVELRKCADGVIA